MKIGIIDSDLIGRNKHRFPNLVCEKISGYWKDHSANVELLLDYNNFDEYDHIYVSKVFTDTPVPDWLKETDKVHIGGTGFYFDHAPNLPNEIEHHKPDYNLYNDWISGEIEKAKAKNPDTFNEKSFRNQFREYTDYSIGYMTRGCFRKCSFCVNKKYNHVTLHSPLAEFYDENRKKICLLDDNFLGCPKWEDILNQLISLNKPFKFKQGIDERLLTDEKCALLFSAKYDGDYTFAFDNICDYDIIHNKLQIIRKYTSASNIKFYVLVGFESIDAQDIENAFKRIELLMRFKCLPYIMRYQNKNFIPWKYSRFRSMYVTLARWCNQPNMFKKLSFRQFCLVNQQQHQTKDTLCSAMRAMTDFERNYPDIAKKYFDLKFEESKDS